MCWPPVCVQGLRLPPCVPPPPLKLRLPLQMEWSEIPRDRLERTFKVNIIAMMSLAQKAVKHMPQGGSIINISSVQAYGEGCPLPSETGAPLQHPGFLRAGCACTQPVAGPHQMKHPHRVQQQPPCLHGLAQHCGHLCCLLVQICFFTFSTLLQMCIKRSCCLNLHLLLSAGPKAPILDYACSKASLLVHAVRLLSIVSIAYNMLRGTAWGLVLRQSAVTKAV